MKKLMTMLAAVGMAFGLFADDPAPATPISSTSFEAASEFDVDGNLVTESTPWSCNDNDAKLTKGVYAGDEYVYPTERPRYADFTAQANYLNVKTAFDKPLVRALTGATVTDDAIFLDQLVKFTAFDSDPEGISDTDKIAFFAKEELDADENPTATNLYVVAGKWANGFSVATNNLGTIDVDAWHRLTVKAMKGYDESALAFEVFLDGTALELSAPAFDATAAATLSDTAKAVNSAKKLFPAISQISALAISGIALAGQGAVDDMMVTTEVPGEWAEDKNVNIAWDDHVTGFTYQIGSDDPVTMTGLQGEGSFPIAYSVSFNVTISDVICDTANNWGFNTVTCDGACSYNDATGIIGFTGEGATATITSKDITPRVSVVIGDVTNTYPTIAAAFATLGDTAATVKFNEALSIGTIAEGTYAGATEGLILGSGDVTLDLNGQTITGTGAQSKLYVIQKNEGKLTIIDSSNGQTGMISAANGWKGAVNAKGSLDVTGGTFVGEVAATAGAISGGKFDKAANGSVEFSLKGLVDGATCDITTEGAYWVVKAAEMVTVTFMANGEQYGDAQTFKKGGTATKPTTDPTKTGYTFKEWQLAGVAFYFGTAINEDTTLVAAFDENTYTIKFSTEGTAVADLEVLYTALPTNIESYTSTKMNYKFGGWYLDDFEKTQIEFADFDGSTELTLEADFSEATPFTLTYNANGGSGEMASKSFTIEDETIDLTANAFTKAGATFKGWNTQADGEGTSYDDEATITLDSTVQLADIELFAQWESAGPTPIDPDVPAVVKADSEEAAKAAVQVARPTGVDDTIVDATTYDGYFVKTAVDKGDDTWEVTATLDPDIVKAEDETKEVLAEVLDLTEAGSIEIKSAKPGLYYSLKQGEEVNDRTEGTRVLAETETVELEAGKWANSGFYQIQVNTKDKK